MTIIAADGTVLGESDEDWSQMDNHIDRPEVIQALESGTGSSTRFSHTVGQQMLYVAVRVTSGEQSLGVVRVALPLQQVAANVADLQRIILGCHPDRGWPGDPAGGPHCRIYHSPNPHPDHQRRRALQVGFHSPDRGDQLVPHSSDEVGKLTRVFKRMGAQIRTQLDALETEREKLTCVLQEMTDGVLIVDDEWAGADAQPGCPEHV